MHTNHNQRCFQCERPKEKTLESVVFRERKVALGSPVNKEERVQGGSWFQGVVPMKAKTILSIEVLARCIRWIKISSCRSSEPSGREVAEDRIWSVGHVDNVSLI